MFHEKQHAARQGGSTRNIAADSAVLARLLEQLGLPSALLSILLAHASAVERNADRLGLVAAGDRELIIPRHSADSLLFAVVRPPAADEVWIDVGSGAGFPGLVLAACYPKTTFTLLEPQQRRAGFLEVQIADIGLANAVVDARRLGEVEADAADMAVARALDEPVRALRSMVRVLRRGGEALVAVGSDQPAPSDPLVRVVSVDDLGCVDSPGRFFMMTHAG